ncbi:hypothetical protein DCO58_10025 [Helicobacter saguini]|uniref:Uncharacterized protein n=1 Tax=Helicobacter saguini TaxID=1548018 RepID=A0A6B0HPY6_9HELI|nr:hypothetical protein [Helicobacter saguini]MWV61358.1 hypothetical protein [Helicobacter saguini]MWV67972.1 hypothetical protein [Helicobacter saguini]MWV70560.1 hypothetical protein [Helicobacter saguini]MWV72464.1 hypothetical protein [Helicobacter saguini]
MVTICLHKLDSYHLLGYGDMSSNISIGFLSSVLINSIYPLGRQYLQVGYRF